MKPLLLLLALIAPLHAAKYFTARNGNDAADGLSAATAFHTIGKGVSALKPGDTLTILPGTYFEGVAAKISGTQDAPITIRAQRPGTVLLRGDVDAPEFRPVDGLKRTYVTDFKPRVEGVGERGTLRLYEPVSSPAEVAQTNATYFQDDAAGRVYVHTSDSAPANGRALAFSVTNGFGILLTAPAGSRTVHDVLIEGLSFTGYQSREFPAEPGSRNRWGLAIVSAERVTVKHCSSFLNSGGFFFLAPLNSLVEDCHAYANVSRFQVVGNNILGWGVSDTTFRHNTVEAFWNAGSSAGDITFYGGGANKDLSPLGIMEDNIAINAGVMIKGAATGSTQRGNVSAGIGSYFYQKHDETNLLLANFENERAQQMYADPLNHDFRLQTDDAATVFFVSPSGNDDATGTSLKSPWKTLAHAAKTARPGDTIYVTAGEYHECLEPARSGTAEKPIQFRRRGFDRVVITGNANTPAAIDLSNRTHVILSGFLIPNARIAIAAKRCEAIRVENMTVTGATQEGVEFSSTKDLVFAHNLIRQSAGAGLLLSDCDNATVTSNLFDAAKGSRVQYDAATLATLWSDRNAFTPSLPTAAEPSLVSIAGKNYRSLAEWQTASGLDADSLTCEPGYRDGAPEASDFALRDDSALIGRGVGDSAIGPFLRTHVDRALPVEDLSLHDAGATTATVDWQTPTRPAESVLEWGETPDCGNKLLSHAAYFHTVSLIHLKLGVHYYYRISSPKPERSLAFAAYVSSAPAKVDASTMQPQSFETAAAPAAPRTIHVAIAGDDHHAGLTSSDALRTINHAAEVARAGDTVLIHAGAYEETVFVRSSGTELSPITFQAAPGETVWLDGSERFRSTAFRIHGKHYITIDGLRFHHFRYAPDIAPVIEIRGGSHLSIRRCFHDGRELQGYVPAFISATDTEDFLLENTVMINGMGEGLTALRSPGLTIRHCVFYNNFIRALTVLQFDPKFEVTLSHNLVCDNIPKKTYNSLFRVSPLSSLHSDHNFFFARKGIDERNIVETYNIGGKTVGFQAPGQYHGENLMLADLRKLASQEQDSRFGNPGIPAAHELLPSGAPDIDWAKAELHREGSAFAPLDFQDFFSDPNNPLTRASDGQPVGLDPMAFRK